MEIYGLLASGGIYDLPIIKQISWLLGLVMNGIYNVMSAIGIENIGVSIIIFTIIVYTILLPLTIKQQKFSKMQSVVTPEVQKIQKKYAGKKDQVSLQKQQDEMNAVYEKYGVKMSSGCLPSLLQLLILFGLYPVVQNIPEYVTKVRNVYTPLVDQIMGVKDHVDILTNVAGNTASLYDFTTSNGITEALYRFQENSWNALIEQMPTVENAARETISEIGRLNNFLGIDIGTHPWNLLTNAFAAASIGGIILAVLIPVLAGLTQFISVKLSQMSSSVSMQDSDNPMMNSMKTMTYTMPLISVVFGFTLPAGLGLYWVASAAVRCVQQLGVNKYLKSKSVEELIEENRKKMKKKIEKKGTSGQEINKMATTSTRNVGSQTSNKNKVSTDPAKEEKIKKAQELAGNAKPGSLTAKANLVSRYNKGQKTEEGSK
ncbi:MAG TPA: YidC/Oxa1 family membrane protein insertase [Candidatus Dorea faecipullorum]|nr:YidC/Oxa1 family membrane protein insertase [Candidatus Dorea faecipullorum]